MNPCPLKALLKCALQFATKMLSKCSKMCQICPPNTSEMAENSVLQGLIMKTFHGFCPKPVVCFLFKLTSPAQLMQDAPLLLGIKSSVKRFCPCFGK